MKDRLECVACTRVCSATWYSTPAVAGIKLSRQNIFPEKAGKGERNRPKMAWLKYLRFGANRRLFLFFVAAGFSMRRRSLPWIEEASPPQAEACGYKVVWTLVHTNSRVD